MTQASVSSLLEVLVPAKRKSDDELLDLRKVHRKVSAIGVTVTYHELTIAHSAISAKGWYLALLALLVPATSSARNVSLTIKAVDGMACRACQSSRRRGRVSSPSLKQSKPSHHRSARRLTCGVDTAFALRRLQPSMSIQNVSASCPQCNKIN